MIAFRSSYLKSISCILSSIIQYTTETVKIQFILAANMVEIYQNKMRSCNSAWRSMGVFSMLFHIQRCAFTAFTANYLVPLSCLLHLSHHTGCVQISINNIPHRSARPIHVGAEYSRNPKSTDHAHESPPGEA